MEGDSLVGHPQRALPSDLYCSLRETSSQEYVHNPVDLSDTSSCPLEAGCPALDGLFELCLEVVPLCSTSQLGKLMSGLGVDGKAWKRAVPWYLVCRALPG